MKYSRQGMVSLLSSSKDAKKKRKRTERKSSAEEIRLKVIVLEATKKTVHTKKAKLSFCVSPL
jgi:hypothetical protein